MAKFRTEDFGLRDERVARTSDSIEMMLVPEEGLDAKIDQCTQHLARFIKSVEVLPVALREAVYDQLIEVLTGD